MGGKLKIMTNFRGDDDVNWKPFVDYFPPPIKKRWLSNIPLLGEYLFSSYHAYLMFKNRKNYDLILLACDRSGVIFAFLQFVFFLNKKPIFYFSNLWEIHENNFIYFLKYIQFLIIEKCSIGYALNSSCDAESYSDAFPVKKEKFVCLPYFPTLWKYSYVVADEGFVFAGGNGQRDYKQLIQAARTLPYKFFIACSNEKLFEGCDIPPNVTVDAVSPQRFRELMASATIHVVALAGGFLRSGGHQTYLNAMVMGKPVIVTDRKGTLDYIVDGVDGFLLEPGDVKGLRKTIDRLMKDKSLRDQLSKNAMKKVEQFNGSQYLKNLRFIAQRKLREIEERGVGWH